jgi:hypothetical protein
VGKQPKSRQYQVNEEIDIGTREKDLDPWDTGLRMVFIGKRIDRWANMIGVYIIDSWKVRDYIVPDLKDTKVCVLSQSTNPPVKTILGSRHSKTRSR